MWCALYFLLAFLIGYAVVCCFDLPLSGFERFGYSACLGPALLGLLLIFTSVLGLRPSRVEILLIATIAAIALAFRLPALRKGVHLPASDGRPRKWWIAISAVFICYAVTVVAVDALILPINEWDAFAIWQLKSKVLVTAALNPRPEYFFDQRLAFSHTRYPLLMPMMSASVNLLSGDPLGSFGKTPALILFLGMAAAVFATIRKFSGTTSAAIVTAFLLNLPAMYSYAGSGTAEMPLTAFYACAVACVLSWMKQGARGYLILGAIFAAFCVSTKNEGALLAAILSAVVMGQQWPPRPKTLLEGILFIAIIAALGAPWWIYASGIPIANADFSKGLGIHAVVQNLASLPMVLRTFGSQLIDWTHWGIFWLAAPALQIAARPGYDSRATRALWAMILLQIFGYIAAFLANTWNLYELLPITIDRLLMQATPVAALLIGLLPGNLNKPAIRLSDSVPASTR